MTRVTPIMPAWWLLIRVLPRNGLVPNGLGKVLIVKSQISPAELLRIENSAIKATSWLRIGALWIGRNRTRSIATPPTNDNPTAAAKAPQYGTPHCIICQARKVENIAISPCAKLRWSIAW